MTTPDIPDGAVEAAVDGIRDRLKWASMHWGVEDVHPDAWPHIARAALTAAAPYIAAQAMAEPLDVTEREPWEQELWRHQPVLSAHDGGVVGCQCMDRVFVAATEDWGTHLTDVIAPLLVVLTRIEALRDEWLSESATAEGNARALDGLSMQDGARTERSYAMTVRRHAAALDALIGGAGNE